MTSKRNIKKRLERLEGGAGYPIASLAELIAAAEDEALETVDGDRRLYRVDGEVREVPQETLDLLTDAARRGDS